MDHPKRSLLKALTWRFFGFIVTTSLVYFYSRDIREALTIGGGTEAIKLVLFYMHERFWNRISFGRSKTPDYQI